MKINRHKINKIDATLWDLRRLNFIRFLNFLTPNLMTEKNKREMCISALKITAAQLSLTVVKTFMIAQNFNSFVNSELCRNHCFKVADFSNVRF